MLSINASKESSMLSKMIYCLVALLILTSCFNKETAYLNHIVNPLIQEDKRFYPLSLLQVNNRIDVVLVIDNSGSMRPIQNSVINNSKLFFEQFAKEAYVDWKIGIVSTDKTEEPYLGFKKSFDSSLVDDNIPGSFDKVVVEFQDAVSELGISGAGYEYTFYNLKRMLDQFGGNTNNSFQRGDSHLVVIMISDEVEQSMTFGDSYEAINFLNTMRGYVTPSKKLRFYGAIKHKQLKDCTNYDSKPWIGSEFEKIITASEGFVVSACVPKFGNELARIGKDIASLVGLPSLLLRRRPVVSTLMVYYEDTLLIPGPVEDGGQWFYEETSNTINFYNLDFVKDLKRDKFRIEFEVDDGVNRG
jgi:hypothetical protein